ncbi:conserved hypothetical protein [Bradyrhizobium oligotrophicum S58]|uniref:Uncharacterized protein n=2 Tax=Bradyrhizobium oligotrophicum TaxID=44255 RepID=M4Z2W1_9BRAD|nr:conserved hypothetical protein [Bradyrhizobium oligotrophicum S58]
MWIDVSSDPDRRPLVRQRVAVTVDEAEKERLIEAGHARADHCSPASGPGASARHWIVRLRLEQRPGIVERLDRYLADAWATWAALERPRRQTIAVYQRLQEMAREAAAAGNDRSCEIVWGIGVSRWRRQGRALDLPLLERLVEIEVLENSDAEIRIRPRMVDGAVNLRAFETPSSAARGTGENVERLLEPVERRGELSPFQPESFKPILSAISSQLDLQGDHRPTMLGSAIPLQEASDRLTISDRWVIFARPRSDELLLRDITRLKFAMDYAPRSECCLDALAHMLLGAPDHLTKERLRRRLSGVIGDPIDVVPAAQAAADQGDLFFPLPTNSDQMEIVRQLRRSDGVVVQGARGPDRTAAIANVVCHHLALGLRVLVVSRNESALALLSEQLPRAIRELTVQLTGSDKDVLKHAETVVGRLLSIVEAMDLADQAEAVSRLERDIIATSQEISRLDDEVGDVARRSVLNLSEVSDLPLDALTSLIADRGTYAWFIDRPSRFLGETELLVSAIDQARAARLRLAGDLAFVDDHLPAVAALPDAAAMTRLHEELQSTGERLDGDRDVRLARHLIATLGVEAADKFAGDLDALAAAHRIIIDEPWLAALSPLRSRPDETSDDGAMLVDFARDASALLPRRAGFLVRPVEIPADAFAKPELLAVVERLSAGERASIFSLSGRALKQTVDAIKVAGFAPKTAADWSHVRDYLKWRRHLHSLDARWRLLAAEIGAPGPEPESSHSFHGYERIIKCVEVAIVTAALARRSVSATVPKLSMADGEIAALLGDGRRLSALAAAVRNAANQLAAQRMELTRLNELFGGDGALASYVRADVLSQIGRDGVDPREIGQRWTAIRRRVQALHDRRADIELLDEVCRELTELGADVFARRIRTEPADRESGDPVLAADWVMAWNWAVLMRQTDDVGQHQRLRDLSNERSTLETRLRELLEQVVVARMHLGFAQNTSGTVRQALTVFMVTLRKMAASCSGPTTGRLRQVAREALESCYEGIPCQIMPAWRVAEQLPARLGAFDLVVIDDGSQSDLRELTTMFRGRKVVVVEDDRPTGDVVGQGGRRIEAVEHAVLRSVPATIRQFLLPGAALCDLVKLLFPNRVIRLREHARRVDPVVLSNAASLPQFAKLPAPAGGTHQPASALALEGRPLSTSSTAHAAYSLEDEIATVAEGLSLARHSSEESDEPTVSMDSPPPDWLSKRTRSTPPSDEARRSARDEAADHEHAAASPDVPAAASPVGGQSAVSVKVAENGAQRWADRFADAASPPLDDAPVAAVVTVLAPQRAETTETRPAFEPVRRTAAIDRSRLTVHGPRPDDVSKRPRRLLPRRIAAAAAVLAVTIVATSIYWQPAATARVTTSWRTALNQLAASWNAGSPAVAQPAGTEPRKVIADRIMPDGKVGAGGDGATETMVSHAVLYQEDPQDPHGKRYLGTVTWHVVPAAGTVPASIKGDVEIDKRMKATLSLRPNVESEMPASHIMEVKFNWPDDPTHVGVDTLKGLSMKARESGRGAPLSALTAKVTPEFFMIALSAGEVDTKRNVLLLKGKEWIDIPIVYSGGSRAVLAIEKGADGERAFKDAFTAWGQ